MEEVLDDYRPLVLSFGPDMLVLKNHRESLKRPGDVPLLSRTSAHKSGHKDTGNSLAMGL